MRPMLCMNKVGLLFLGLVFSVSVYCAEISEETEQQIEHLLTFISSSPCQFMRNGKWYLASDAADHIRKKYNYVLKKGLVKTPEDFIEYSATKSSMSGKAYQVQCGDGAKMKSADWLQAELARYRNISNDDARETP